MRPTYTEIDLAAIRHNVAAFKELIEPSAVCTVVKADGYGHGDVPVANAALDAGAAYLAVALVEEGIRLREAGIGARVILLSEPDPEAAEDIARWELEPTVYSQPFLDALENTGARLPVHVKVNTGMHRVGATPEQATHLAGEIRKSPTVTFASLWTHFAVADEDPEFTRRQIERFEAIASRLNPPMTHLANTAGAILHPEARGDLCRIGLGTYGLHPCSSTRGRIDLRPAMRVVTHVTHVQRLEAGERPSYGRVRELSRTATVVTAPIGYADGFPRLLTNSGSVLIHGKNFPLAGTVTMDQIVIDVGDEDVGVGEEVVLLGAQGNEEITADEWAESLDTISYEVVCSIGPRVPRRYL
ncbi:MAG TPA: alanine racemase [Acidimicrobiia bacterium]|nr:alanine racemase [Acidimicrobiia bacterium]